jgi:hypothetical protein
VQVAALAVLIIAALALARALRADARQLAIHPLLSPQPIMLTVDCQRGWNPSCRTSAVGQPGVRLYSYFYIDNRYRGTATRTYTNVCRLFYLIDGSHSTKAYARDLRGNSATAGPIRDAIRCDRTRPVVSVGLMTRYGKTSANPNATDRMSGLATKAFYVDSVARAWKVHTDLCSQLGLGRGYHYAWVTARDNAGNSSTTYHYRFWCS